MRVTLEVWMILWSCLTVGATLAPTQTSAPAADKATGSAPTAPDVPTWAAEARWYEVVVDRFHSGEASNDPEGTVPWSVSLPPDAQTSATLSFGGDLQGLSQKLPYVRALGANALCLSPIFADCSTGGSDLRHVAGSLSARSGSEQNPEETADSATWRFTPGDRVFLKLLPDAHAQGLRVVVTAAFAEQKLEKLTPEAEQNLLAATKRWLDPDQNGDPSDGVDGWRITEVERLPRVFWQRWRTGVKKINPDALLIAEVRDDPTDWLKGDTFDVIVNDRAGQAVARFFAQADPSYTLDKFFKELDALRGELPHDTNVALLNRLSSRGSGRLLDRIVAAGEKKQDKPGAPPTTPHQATEADLARWRLAHIFLHYYVGAPLTWYGDEVGMTESVQGLCTPMWWPDLPGKETKSPDYRGDFYALMQMLHTVREVHEPVRRGTYRTILLDGEKKVLIFGRKVQGKEVVLALNYGDQPQRVKFALGKPGQLVGVLTPQLTARMRNRSANQPARRSASTKIPELNYGKGRQPVNQAGEVTLDLKPQSMRLLLAWDEEPQKPAKQKKE